MRTIEQIAEENDASILTDEHGHIALLRRHYDNEGKEEVRYRPDPCHFIPESEWLAEKGIVA